MRMVALSDRAHSPSNAAAIVAILCIVTILLIAVMGKKCADCANRTRVFRMRTGVLSTNRNRRGVVVGT